jgi:hypothetical protein
MLFSSGIQGNDVIDGIVLEENLCPADTSPLSFAVWREKYHPPQSKKSTIHPKKT